MHPIITISGPSGSGKSTIAKILTEKLSAKRVYVGGIRRQLALDKGMSLAQLNEYAQNHPETDVDVDKAAAKQARELAKDSLVIVEGRTQFYFIPESIKIYIKVELHEGARRIWQDLQNQEAKAKRNEGDFKSLAEIEEYQKTKEINDIARYQKYYKINHADEKHYDFVLDTTKISAQEAAEKTLLFIQKTLNKAIDPVKSRTDRLTRKIKYNQTRIL